MSKTNMQYTEFYVWRAAQREGRGTGNEHPGTADFADARSNASLLVHRGQRDRQTAEILMISDGYRVTWLQKPLDLFRTGLYSDKRFPFCVLG